MQYSEELGIGDELHSWRLQQQGDFLRIHRRKGTFPPNLWTKKTKPQNLINVVPSKFYYLACKSDKNKTTNHLPNAPTLAFPRQSCWQTDGCPYV